MKYSVLLPGYNLRLHTRRYRMSCATISLITN